MHIVSNVCAYRFKRIIMHCSYFFLYEHEKGYNFYICVHPQNKKMGLLHSNFIFLQNERPFWCAMWYRASLVTSGWTFLGKFLSWHPIWHGRDCQLQKRGASKVSNRKKQVSFGFWWIKCLILKSVMKMSSYFKIQQVCSSRVCSLIVFKKFAKGLIQTCPEQLS